jgi:hypothetical protein
MTTVYLDLKFMFPGPTGNASAYVVPRMYSQDGDGTILLTPESADLSELESYVSSMRDDLDKILIEARKRFAKAEAAGPQPIFPRLDHQ